MRTPNAKALHDEHIKDNPDRLQIQPESSHMKHLSMAILLFMSASASALEPTLPCAETDKKCAREFALKNPVKQKSFWAESMAKPVDERIATAPPQLLMYLTLDNIAAGVPNRPRATDVSAELMADIKAALAEIPAPVKKLVDKKLAGIYLVRDLGGTGLTDYANAGFAGKDAGFIVLDADVFTKENAQTANGWATWKESTPFKKGNALRLEALIESPENNNRKNAIQYILLHELGHVLSIGENIHPRWDGPASSVEKFPFSTLSWKSPNAEGKYRTRFDGDFPQQRQLVYYFGAQISEEFLLDTYLQWSRTSFPTLYAATSPGDDFAESFASYVHTVIQQRPWKINIYRYGKLVQNYDVGWEEKRCDEKRAMMEKILSGKFD
jgi:hypothetical protein